MRRIKSFYIQEEPTRKKFNELSVLVDKTLNEWFDLMGDTIKNVRISQSADTSLSFPEAFIIVTYETNGDGEPVDAEQEAPVPEAAPGSEVPAESEGKKPQRFGKKK